MNNHLRHAGLTALLLLSYHARAQDTQCLYATFQEAVTHIEYLFETNEGIAIQKGSGFIVSPRGHVLTNSHVVSPPEAGMKVISAKLSVRAGGLFNPAVTATILSRDNNNDLALIQLPPRPEGPWPALTIGNQASLPVGEPLASIGYGGGDISIVPAGTKTADNTVLNGELKPWWQTNLALNHGNSGGPIFGSLGTVVGMAVAKNDNTQLVTYIIPISYAQHLLEVAKVKPVAYAQCAQFPLCRSERHGIEKYEVNEPAQGWSDWRSGGYNRAAYCNDLLGALKTRYPASSFTFVSDNEQSRETGIRHFEYRYYCEYRRVERPIYKEQRSQACLR